MAASGSRERGEVYTDLADARAPSSKPGRVRTDGAVDCDQIVCSCEAPEGAEPDATRDTTQFGHAGRTLAIANNR